MARLHDLMLEVVRRLIGTCIPLIASCAFAQDAADWTTVRAVSLGAGERAILLLQQKGFDLAARILVGDEVVAIQEGPDYAFGTEVLALENTSSSARDYEVQVAAALDFENPDFLLTKFPLNNSRDWSVAVALHDAARIWNRPGSLASEVINLLEPLAEQAASSPLNEILWLSYGDALVRSGQTERAIAVLGEHLVDRARNSPTSIYLHWQYVVALYQGLYVPEALEQAEALVASLDEIPVSSYGNEIEAQWLAAQVKNSLGAIRVGAARLHGDDDLMRSGGELMIANLQSVQNHPDITLRARLTEYLAGFYSFSEGRSNPISRQLLQEAEALYLEAGDDGPISALRNNQAYAALGRGDFSAAQRLYLEALELRASSKHEEGHAFVRARLGYLYYTLGDFRRARVRYEESIAIYQRLGLARRLVHNQLELAEVLRSTGDNKTALELLYTIQSSMSEQESLEARLRLGSQIAHNLIDLGDESGAAETISAFSTEFALDTDSGRERLEFASRLFYVLEYDILQARLQLALGEVSAALDLINESLALLIDQQSEPLQHLELLHLQMLADIAQGDIERVQETGQRAVQLINAVRDDVDYQFQGARWSSRTAHLQQLLMATYLEEFRNSGDRRSLDTALVLDQRSRALDLRRSREAQRRSMQIPELQELRASVAQVRQELVSAILAGTRTGRLERELARYEEQFQSRRLELFAGNPELVSLNREQIQRRLPPQTSAFIYSIGDQFSHLVILGQGGSSVRELPPMSELSAIVEASLQELALPGSGLTNTRQLADLLFPEDVPITGQRLLIEAEGLLTRIPFNVLAFMQATEEEKAANIVMVPSLSEYFRDIQLDSPGAPQRLQVAIVADPIVNISALSDSQESKEPVFPRLPYTRIEAEAIQETFPARSTRAFLGAEASIANLHHESSRSARILHIASHGFASVDDPLVLGLALANQSGSPVASGLLTADQISSAEFTNELVVVSACETGVGQALKGEPLMSIGRMFLANGAKSALTTLWPISDRANAQFMSSFYQALGALGLPPEEALSYAQADLMQIPRYRHPFYWGAFQYQSVEQGSQPVLF